MDKYKSYFKKEVSIAAKKKAITAKNKIRFYYPYYIYTLGGLPGKSISSF